eukprot:s1527_g18.t1
MPVAGPKDATAIARRRRHGSPFDACPGAVVCLISGLMLWHRAGCCFGFRHSSPGALSCLGPVRWRGRIPDAAAQAKIIAAGRALDPSDPFSPLPPQAGVCLGKFDALHLGHQALAQAARDMGFEPWMISFSGMAEVLGWKPRKPLLAPEHRLDVLRSFGAQERVLPFSQVQKLSPPDFVDLLVDRLGVSAVICGADFRFGFKAKGDADMLRTLAEERGIGVKVVPLETSTSKDVKLSSSLVRQLLAEGDMRSAAAVLGRPYRIFWQRSRCSRGTTLHVMGPSNEVPKAGRYDVYIGARSPNAGPTTVQVSGSQGILELSADCSEMSGDAVDMHFGR